MVASTLARSKSKRATSEAVRSFLPFRTGEKLFEINNFNCFSNKCACYRMKRSGACIRTQCKLFVINCCFYMFRSFTFSGDHFAAGKKSVENNQLVNYIGINRTFGSELNYKNVAYLPNKFCPGYFQLISETGTRWRSLIDLNFGIDLSGVSRQSTGPGKEARCEGIMSAACKEP